MEITAHTTLRILVSYSSGLSAPATLGLGLQVYVGTEHDARNLPCQVCLFRLKTLAILTGRLAKMLGAVTAEIRERREVHRIGYLSERQAFIIQIVF